MTADFAAAEQPKTLTCKRCGKSFPDTGDSMDTVHTCTALVVKEEQDKGSKLEALIEKYRWVVSHSTKEASESIITAAREEHTSLNTDNSELRDRLTAAVNAHEKLFSENATLHKIVGEMVEGLDKLARLGNEPEFGNSHGNKIAQDLLAKAKLEIGEGR